MWLQEICHIIILVKLSNSVQFIHFFNEIKYTRLHQRNVHHFIFFCYEMCTCISQFNDFQKVKPNWRFFIGIYALDTLFKGNCPGRLILEINTLLTKFLNKMCLKHKFPSIANEKTKSLKPIINRGFV